MHVCVRARRILIQHVQTLSPPPSLPPFYVQHTVRRTVISEARAFSREDLRRRDEIDEEIANGGRGGTRQTRKFNEISSRKKTREELARFRFRNQRHVSFLFAAGKLEISEN